MPRRTPGRRLPAGWRTIESLLPPGASLQSVAARSGAVAEMTAAFRINLTALSLLALVVGMFLIYNTMTFSVVQRRPLFGTLRCLGVTRRRSFAGGRRGAAGRRWSARSWRGCWACCLARARCDW